MSETTPIHSVQYLERIDERDGGVVRFLLNFCQDLAARGNRVTLLTQDDRDAPPEWSSKPDANPRLVKVALPRRPWGELSSETKAIVEPLLAEADVLHLHTVWDPSNVPLAGLAQEHNVPYVISAHGMLNDWAMRFKRFKKRVYMAMYGRRLLAGAARIHCTAEGERRQAIKHLPVDNTIVVPLSFDGAGFGELPGPELIRQQLPALVTGQPTVLTLGRLNVVKRVELLIEAVSLLHQQGQPVQLVLAGPPEQQDYVERLERLIARLNLADSVHFVGTIVGQEKVSLYQAADAFVLPSWQECFGMVLAEALAAETPVVTTKKVDTWPEFAEAGAVIVDDTPEALATAIGELLDDASRSAELGRRGREYVLRWLDPSTVMAEYEQLYRDVIAADC